MAQRTGQEADVRQSLVESLYASPASLTIGAATGTAVGIAISSLSDFAAIHAVVIAVCVVAALRVVSAIFFHRQLVRGTAVASRNWELAYELGAWAYAGLLGLMGFVTLIGSGNPVIHMALLHNAYGAQASVYLMLLCDPGGDRRSYF